MVMVNLQWFMAGLLVLIWWLERMGMKAEGGRETGKFSSVGGCDLFVEGKAL
jgi:hypothetical protein